MSAVADRERDRDPAWVYDWRRGQEAALRARRGAGMTDEQVVRFCRRLLSRLRAVHR
ncbi:hypothetical protein SAMD00023353_0101350 [Rosellinia necatrix]|uniref:Uncharacterized protein n=1 Tax=Rosellinia necatrix TaxID=77044 RepID=A0A1S8A4L5_ROSNE|nr:hypothetical protein SAMD00023353_0101350 [Rosellinia necatrix]